VTSGTHAWACRVRPGLFDSDEPAPAPRTPRSQMPTGRTAAVPSGQGGASRPELQRRGRRSS